MMLLTPCSRRRLGRRGVVARSESVGDGFEKMAQCCGSLPSVKCCLYAQSLSLGGSSDEAAAVIANHVRALGVGCVSERGDGSGPSFPLR